MKEGRKYIRIWVGTLGYLFAGLWHMFLWFFFYIATTLVHLRRIVCFKGPLILTDSIYLRIIRAQTKKNSSFFFGSVIVLIL